MCMCVCVRVRACMRVCVSEATVAYVDGVQWYIIQQSLSGEGGNDKVGQ